MNYYEILEVSINASKEVIKNAYRALIKKYHPDSYKGDKQYAEEMIKKINEAYETLSDENKRLLYDYDNGFKIDPNAQIEETIEEEIVEKETKIKEEKFKIDEFVKKYKAIVVVIVCIVFVLAFLIGNLIAGNSEDKQEQDVKKDTKIENDKKDVQDNKYSPNYDYKYNNTNIPKDNSQTTTNDDKKEDTNTTKTDNDDTINDKENEENNKTDINSGIS